MNYVQQVGSCYLALFSFCSSLIVIQVCIWAFITSYQPITSINLTWIIGSVFEFLCILFLTETV